MTISPQKVLVLAPHTDDGELGCGGSLARLSNEGIEILYLAFSCLTDFQDGILIRECENSAKILNMKTEILTYPARHLSEYRQEILDKLIVIKNLFAPDLVFTPSVFDIHQDHQAVTNEAIRAFKHTTILGYETPWNNLEFKTNYFIKLSENDIAKKTDAINCYKSQSQKIYTNNGFIYSLAQVRGAQIGTKYAEAFETIRVIL